MSLEEQTKLSTKAFQQIFSQKHMDFGDPKNSKKRATSAQPTLRSGNMKNALQFNAKDTTQVKRIEQAMKETGAKHNILDNKMTNKTMASSNFTSESQFTKKRVVSNVDSNVGSDPQSIPSTGIRYSPPNNASPISLQNQKNTGDVIPARMKTDTFNKNQYDKQFQVKLAMGDTANDRFSPTRPNTVKDALLHARKMSETSGGRSPDQMNTYKNEVFCDTDGNDKHSYGESPMSMDPNRTMMRRVADDDNDSCCGEEKEIVEVQKKLGKQYTLDQQRYNHECDQEPQRKEIEPIEENKNEESKYRDTNQSTTHKDTNGPQSSTTNHRQTQTGPKSIMRSSSLNEMNKRQNHGIFRMFCCSRQTMVNTNNNIKHTPKPIKQKKPRRSKLDRSERD